MLLFFVLFSFALSKRAEVYGIFTDFGPGLKRTIVQLGSVDVSSGNVTQLQSLFVYEGSSGTFDGISAFDQDAGLFYFVNDFANSYVFGVSVRPPYSLTAPIWLEDDAVGSLSFDWKSKQLLISDFIKATQQSRLVIYPISLTKSTKVINLPGNFSIGIGAFDPEKNQWFNNAQVSADSSVLSTVSLSSQSNNITSSVNLNCGIIEKLWVESKHPDFDSRLWGVKGTQSGQYDLLNIDPVAGTCRSLRIPSKGIVTAFAFDQHNGVLFYHDATNSGNYLRQSSVRTGGTSSTLLKSQFPLSDLAVRFIE